MAVTVSEERDHSLIIEMDNMRDFPLAVALVVGRPISHIWTELADWNDEATVTDGLGAGDGLEGDAVPHQPEIADLVIGQQNPTHMQRHAYVLPDHGFTCRGGPIPGRHGGLLTGPAGRSSLGTAAW